MRLCMCVVEQPKALDGERAGAFLGLHLPFFLFFLLNLSNIENGRGCEFLWDCRSGVSKANSRSGWVCLLGEVLDFCDKRSCETVSEMFDFCDNISWDVAAELLLWGVMFCIRSSNGFWRDGDKKKLSCML